MAKLVKVTNEAQDEKPPSVQDTEPPSLGTEELLPNWYSNHKSLQQVTRDTTAHWQREIAQASTCADDLSGWWRSGDPREDCFDEVAAKYPVRIPEYYRSLIDFDDPDDPIAMMALPDSRELASCPSLYRDPLEEDEDMPVERLVHRYSDRALLISTTTCAMYCRFCTRKRLAGKGSGKITQKNLDAVVSYLKLHPEIRDVIVSGGDPFTMSDQQIGHILAALRTVPTVQILRVGTRVPAVLPSRVTANLAKTLAKYAPIYVNTHFNHPRELTPEAVAALGKLADAGIPIGNQTVLLAGINDRPEIMAELFRKLLASRVKPYYLFQCDLTEGVEHLRTPLSKGIEIMEALRGRLSGLAIPTFVVDSPHGGGKVPISPVYVVSAAPNRTVLRNFAGQMMVYPDPVPSGGIRQDGGGVVHDGVAALLSGALDLLGPRPEEQSIRRHSRFRGEAKKSGKWVAGESAPVKVGLAFNMKRTDSLVSDAEAEFDSPRTIDAIDEALQSLGYPVVRLEADYSFPSRLAAADVDVVFNIAEGLRGRSREAQVPALCEMMGIQYTGSDPLTLAAGLDKAVSKRLLSTAGVTTPAGFLINGSPAKVPDNFSFPVIAKPNAEGSSKGIDTYSVANDEQELFSLVEMLRKRYGKGTGIIVEQFVKGREITVGLIAGKGGRLTALDPMEVVFLQDDGYNVYGYDLKQNWDGRLTYQCPARLGDRLARACKNMAINAAKALGCRDVARVDLRLDKAGVPWVIEVNPLPGLTPGYSDMVMIAEAAGLSYRELIGRILEPALVRLGAKSKVGGPAAVAGTSTGTGAGVAGGGGRNGVS